MVVVSGQRSFVRGWIETRWCVRGGGGQPHAWRYPRPGVPEGAEEPVLVTKASDATAEDNSANTARSIDRVAASPMQPSESTSRNTCLTGCGPPTTVASALVRTPIVVSWERRAPKRDGLAPTTDTGLPSKADWPYGRDAQSMRFFSTPVMLPLYSGEAIRMASAARILARNSRTVSGRQIALGILVEERYLSCTVVDIDFNRRRRPVASRPRATSCCRSRA